MYREFCPYIKYEERGKLNKRAIVSVNIILRMLLQITEDFHLELGKLITGSTKNPKNKIGQFLLLFIVFGCVLSLSIGFYISSYNNVYPRDIER